MGYKVTPAVRSLNLDARYYGTLNPTFNTSFTLSGLNAASGYSSGLIPTTTLPFSASIVFKFGAPASTP